MSDDVADVLIIGAGASGAAVAWSLAETRMRVVCLEQGDWVNPSSYPTNSANWEHQAFGPWSIDPNVRGLETDIGAAEVRQSSGLSHQFSLQLAHQFSRQHQ